MKIEDVKKDRKERRTIRINMKILPSVSKFMKEHNVSPTKVFDEAMKELMEQTLNKGNEK